MVADIFAITSASVSASADFFQRMSASATYQVSASALAKMPALVNPAEIEVTPK
jgi:hypothetical protein